MSIAVAVGVGALAGAAPSLLGYTAWRVALEINYWRGKRTRRQAEIAYYRSVTLDRRASIFDRQEADVWLAKRGLW